VGMAAYWRRYAAIPTANGFMIQNLASGLCMMPNSATAAVAAEIVFGECDSANPVFTFTAVKTENPQYVGGFVLKSVQTGYCVMPEGELALTENTKLVYSASCDLDGQIFLAVPATSTDAGLSLSVDCAFVSNEQVDSIYLNGIDFSGSCSSTVANDCQNPIEFKQPPIAGAVLAF